MAVTALIVEDHPEQAELVARILGMRAYQSIVAENGEIALRMAKERLPDVVLLDLMLPDINGFDVCRRLRTDRSTMLIPVVMLTALNDVQHKVHGFRVGANAYLTKPYGVDALFEAISSACAWRQSMANRALQGEIHVEHQQRDQFPSGLERLFDAGLPVDAALQRPGGAASAGRHGDGPQRDRVGQPSPVGSPGQDHLPGARRPAGNRGLRPGAGL